MRSAQNSWMFGSTSMVVEVQSDPSFIRMKLGSKANH